MGKLLLPRATTTQRMTITPDVSEVIYDTDIKTLYFGNGLTVGGVTIGGDMQSSVYDPNGVAGDSFNIDNMVESVSLKIMTEAERIKLAGLSTGATVNSSDEYLLARANHTGTQLSSTISDFDTAVSTNDDVLANTAKITNATHTGEVTGMISLTITDNIIGEDKLKVNSPTNDYVLTADSSESGGMKWAEAAGIGGGAWGEITGVLSSQGDLGAALDAKVEKVSGKQLSDENYTLAEQSKLSGIAPGAEVNVQSDWDATSGDSVIQNKPALSIVATSNSYNDLDDQPDLSVFDNVNEYTNLAAFPATGSDDRFYLAQDTGIVYRWTGSSYVRISSSLVLGETSSTAYRGDRGKTGYDHSQVSSGNPHSVTKGEVGLGSVPNTDFTSLVSANTAKTSNATHTGEVTGDTTLTLDKTSITNKTATAPNVADYILFSDTSDSGNLKRGLLSDMPGGGGGGGAWGTITGTLSDQGDLQTELDDKAEVAIQATEPAADIDYWIDTDDNSSISMDWGLITGVLTDQADLQSALDTLVPETRTVAGKALSTDITIGASDLSASGRTTTKFLRGDNTWQLITNTSYAEITTTEIDSGTTSTLRTLTGRRAGYIIGKATDYTDTAVSSLVPNTLTVNTKPLSSNVVLTTSDIVDSTDKRYVTDAELTVLGNTSNTNTGDQTISDATISLTDITTNDFSTTKHGFVPKGTGVGKFLMDDGNWTTAPGAGAGGGDAFTTNPLSQFASTTSSQLKGVMSDETGSGKLVFATSPTLVTPVLGTPASGDLANCTFPTLNQDTTGSAATLTTARSIDGVAFDGSSNVKVIAEATHSAMNKATPADTDEIPLIDNVGTSLLKRLSWANLKSKIIAAVSSNFYPVGTPYYNKTNPTNPATLLGFGTWEALPDVVLGGISNTPGSIFNTMAGSIVGELKHTMTSGELATHTHGQNSHNHSQYAHSHAVTGRGDQGGAPGLRFGTATYPQDISQATTSITASNRPTTASNQNTGNSTPFNIVQKTMVGYLWVRTA